MGVTAGILASVAAIGGTGVGIYSAVQSSQAAAKAKKAAPPSPTPVLAQTAADAEAARRKALLSQNRTPTVLTSPLGLGGQASGKKTVLGAG